MGRQARSRSVRPSDRPIYLSPPTPLKENRLSGMAGGENFPLARSLVGGPIVRASRARTTATCPEGPCAALME
eukprot:876356-Pleurochrysis_carterae.AAC.1